MQNDFITGVLGSLEAQAVVEPVGKLITAYRDGGWPVIYTADTHPGADYDTPQSQECGRIPRHCIENSEGCRIVEPLKPDDVSKVIEKPGFLSLALPQTIGELAPDTVLELCGVCTDICVVSNALYLRACYPNNRIVVRADCCAGTTAENHAAALSVMRSCLVDIV